MEAARLNRRAALLPLLLLALPTPPRAASGDEFAAALTEALVIGAKRAVTELGRPDGFLGDPEVRVPLPGMLAQARSALALVGLAGLADDLEVRLNRAAEQAVPVAGELLVGAIRSLSFEDGVGILRGPEDAATRYLDRETGDELAVRMRPIVDDALAQAGAVQALDALAGQYARLPFVSGLRADLTGHVLDCARRAIFGRLGDEEARIREDPAACTTDLLRRVFGQR
jgi:hypothetical protein